MFNYHGIGHQRMFNYIPFEFKVIKDELKNGTLSPQDAIVKIIEELNNITVDCEDDTFED